jgi:NAD(P)-dependent dehydrogenase (short-subunit alcohol dehydrogenase family)
VAIVTGSNTGIGFETAQELVQRGYIVIMACRSRDRALQAINDLLIHNDNSKQGTGKAVFEHPLDLASFDSIQKFCRHIQSKYDHIDLLINNAGRNTSGPSEHGLDLLFQTNFLGHFYLTKQLLPLLLLSSKSSNNGDDMQPQRQSRVINLASVMHHFCGTNRSRRNGHDEAYWKRHALWSHNKWAVTESSYSASKLAAILFTMELNRRYRHLGLRSFAVNPGAV